MGMVTTFNYGPTKWHRAVNTPSHPTYPPGGISKPGRLGTVKRTLLSFCCCPARCPLAPCGPCCIMCITENESDPVLLKLPARFQQRLLIALRWPGVYKGWHWQRWRTTLCVTGVWGGGSVALCVTEEEPVALHG